MLFKTVSRVLLADFLYHETVGHFPFTVYTYSMASRGTVKLLSLGKGRSSGKLLPKVEGRGQQLPRACLLTEGQLNTKKCRDTMKTEIKLFHFVKRMIR